MLFLQLCPGVFQHMLRLHGKAAEELPFRLMLPQIRQDILRPGQRYHRIAVLFLLLFCGDFGGAIIRHSRRHNHGILLCRTGCDRLVHLLRCCHGNGFRKQRRRQCSRSGHQCDLCPTACSALRQRITHLPCGMIGQIPHRIQGFLGGSGCNQNLFAAEVFFTGDFL